MIKLVAFDLDGTLLTDEKEITKRTLDAMYAAADKGILMVPTTGRLFRGMPQVIQDLPFVRYAITINGAAVYDVERDKTVYQAELTHADMRKIFHTIASADAICTVYQQGNGWIDTTDYTELRRMFYARTPKIAENMKRTNRPIDHMRDAVFEMGDTVQKIQLYFGDMDERARMFEIVKRELPEYAITSSIPNNMEINAAGANKGQALEALCEYLGLAREESMAFGDGNNDISMILKAGIGVAMANAVPQVLEAADRVTTSNNEDGVAAVLEELLQE